MLYVHDDEVTFNVFKAMKFPIDNDECYQVDVVDKLIVEKLEEEHPKLPLEICIIHSDSTKSPWYTNIVNYLVCSLFSPYSSFQKKKKFLSNTKYYQWKDPILYKCCADPLIRRCMPEEEMESILHHCHTRKVDGHFGPTKTAAEILQSGFYWPSLFKDAYIFVAACNAFQRSEISQGRTRCHLTTY